MAPLDAGPAVRRYQHSDSGSPQEIRQRLRDDFVKAGATGGLEVTTAGSLAAGTGVGRMRWLL